MVRRLRIKWFMANNEGQHEKVPRETEKPKKVFRHPTLDEVREESMADEGGHAGAEMEAEDRDEEDDSDDWVAVPIHRERRFG